MRIRVLLIICTINVSNQNNDNELIEDEEDCADGEGDDDLGEVLVGRRPAVPDPHAQGQGTDQAAN